MTEPAIRHMTFEEFSRWDDGTDMRYELIDGFPVAMAPPAEAHRILAVRLVSCIDAALAGRRPCNAQIEPGVVRPDRADSYYVPDIAVTCEPNESGPQAVVDPILIVEILSPSTKRTDRRLELPAYQTVESVREIMLIDADSHHGELYRRENDRWPIQLVRGVEATLFPTTVDLWNAMSELYEGIAISAMTAGF